LPVLFFCVFLFNKKGAVKKPNNLW